MTSLQCHSPGWLEVRKSPQDPAEHRGRGNYSMMLIVAISWAVVIRCAIGLGSFSGEAKPPMHGDFEAQRHWLEITVNLPTHEWYENSTRNNLNYWGLDYPPLTALHSLAMGWTAKHVIRAPHWVALNASRGLESPPLKAFMRGQSLLVDLTLFLSALSYFYFLVLPRRCILPGSSSVASSTSSLSSSSSPPSFLALFCVAILYPGQILIDHGHFQFNAASLGLFVWAVNFLLLSEKSHSAVHSNGKRLIGSAIFTLSLLYKQMQLYYSLAIFALLVGHVVGPILIGCCSMLRVPAKNGSSKNVNKSANKTSTNKHTHRQAVASSRSFVQSGFSLFLQLSSLVALMMLFACWPFISSPPTSLVSSSSPPRSGSSQFSLPFSLSFSRDRAFRFMRRIFPLYRGLYEDKVANFWCVIAQPLLRKLHSSSPGGSLSWLSSISARMLHTTPSSSTSSASPSASNLQHHLVTACALLTLCAALPACLCVALRSCALYFKRRRRASSPSASFSSSSVSPSLAGTSLLYALFLVSLSFFLFSFHVHEKSILLPATVAQLLLPLKPAMATHFLLVSALSMWPLYRKDFMVGCAALLIGAYTALSLLLLLARPLRIVVAQHHRKVSGRSIALITLTVANSIAFATLFCLDLCVPPPPHLPHLYPLLISAVSFANFVLSYLYFSVQIWRLRNN